MSSASQRPFTTRGAILQLSLFFLATLGTVAVLALQAAKHGGLAKNPTLVPLCMLTPMIAAVIVQKLSGRPLLGDRGLGFAWGKLSLWVLGPLGAAAFVIASVALSVVVTPGVGASAAESIQAVTHHLSVPHDLSLPAQAAIAAVLVVLVGPVVNLPIFLGEEVGWRGFMNPRMTALFGTPGLIAGGALWALWHLPLILLGHNYPHQPWLGLAVWVPICACLNIMLQHLRQSSRSIFPCALAHGMINQLGLLLLVVFLRQRAYNELVDGPAGLVGLAVLLPPAIWSYRRLSRDAVDRDRSEDAPAGAAAFAPAG